MAITWQTASGTILTTSNGSNVNSPVNAYTTDATVSYTVQAGTLPSGLTLNGATGELAGVPTVAGTYTFTIRATKGVDIKDRDFTMTIV